VTVTGGRFAVDDLPACELSFSAIWRGRPVAQHASVPAGGTARLELPIGEPRDKTPADRSRRRPLTSSSAPA
jgi:hypothetical protein